MILSILGAIVALLIWRATQRRGAGANICSCYGDGSWRDGHKFAWQAPDAESDEGPGLTWRQLTTHHWSGSRNGKLHGTMTADGQRWLAHLRLEDPPGLSPITTIGRFDTVEAAQLATDEAWAAR